MDLPSDCARSTSGDIPRITNAAEAVGSVVTNPSSRH